MTLYIVLFLDHTRSEMCIPFKFNQALQVSSCYILGNWHSFSGTW